MIDLGLLIVTAWGPELSLHLFSRKKPQSNKKINYFTCLEALCPAWVFKQTFTDMYIHTECFDAILGVPFYR